MGFFETLAQRSASAQVDWQRRSGNTVGAQIKAANFPGEFSGKPRILILACENDACPALDMAAMNRNDYGAWVRAIPVRCLGSGSGAWRA
jgi:quinone-modifying oxidoreductase subunit QmoB